MYIYCASVCPGTVTVFVHGQRLLLSVQIVKNLDFFLGFGFLILGLANKIRFDTLLCYQLGFPVLIYFYFPTVELQITWTVRLGAKKLSSALTSTYKTHMALSQRT